MAGLVAGDDPLFDQWMRDGGFEPGSTIPGRVAADDPRRGGGIFGRPRHMPMMAPGAAPMGGMTPDMNGMNGMKEQVAPKRGGGFFGKDGAGLNILGILGDALSRGPMLYTQGKMQQRKDVRDREQAAEQRRQEWDDFTRQYDYKRANPTAQAPDVFTRTLMAAGIDPASDQGRELYNKRVNAMASPPQFVPDGFGGGTFVNRGAPMGGDDDAPDELPADFNFGQGGPTQPASGGFRR